MLAANVVETAVVGLADQRVDRSHVLVAGLIDRPPHETFNAAPTLSVLVSAIGVSIVPSSSTCVEPASLPNALPTNTAPGTLSWNTLPACGTITVTPVRT